MLTQVNPSQAMLSYTLSTSTSYYGGQAAYLTSAGAKPLGVTELLAGARFIGLFLTCYSEDNSYGNGYTTLVKPPCTVELYSGYSKHNQTDSYPYHTADGWVAGDPVYLGYDYIWHRAAAAGTAAGAVIFGTVEEAPSGTKGLVVYFYPAQE